MSSPAVGFPVSDWSVMRIYPRFLRLIGPFCSVHVEPYLEHPEGSQVVRIRQLVVPRQIKRGRRGGWLGDWEHSGRRVATARKGGRATRARSAQSPAPTLLLGKRWTPPQWS
eukprot:9446834-Pyramimonas_sp.AAC.1